MRNAQGRLSDGPGQLKAACLDDAATTLCTEGLEIDLEVHQHCCQLLHEMPTVFAKLQACPLHPRFMSGTQQAHPVSFHLCRPDVGSMMLRSSVCRRLHHVLQEILGMCPRSRSTIPVVHAWYRLTRQMSNDQTDQTGVQGPCAILLGCAEI